MGFKKLLSAALALVSISAFAAGPTHYQLPATDFSGAVTGTTYAGALLGNATTSTTAGALSPGSLTNAMVNSSAAIAYSKLNLGGAILNSDLAGSIAYSKLSLTGAILNADLAGSIAYSKLSLAGSLVNADVASGAAIAYSKLNLGSSILNSDISGGAAIAYSKLALTGSILNADLAGSIAYSKLSLGGSILNADLAGSIAYSKLSLATSIVNGDISNSAAIAYAKLALSNSIVNADVASGAAIAYSKLSLAGSILNADLAGAIADSKLATSYLKADGSRPLTAGWTTGAFPITMGQALTITNAAVEGTPGSATTIKTGDTDTVGLVIQGDLNNGVSLQPDAVSGLALWLKGNADYYSDTGCTTPATADGTAVKCWKDQSSNHYDATNATGAVLKTSIYNGLPTLRFSGVHLTNAAFPALGTSDFTVIAVLAQTTLSSNVTPYAFGTNSTGQAFFLYTDTGGGAYFHGVWANNFLSNPGPFVANTLAISGYKESGSTGSATFNNGGLTSASSPVNIVGNGYDIGSLNGAVPWVGDVEEFIVFNRAISSPEYSGIQAYLSDKYNITISGATDQTAALTQWKNSAGTTLASVSATGVVTAPSFVGPVTGLASSATALAANGSNCTNQFPRGVDASGAVESCASVSESDITGSTITVSSLASSVLKTADLTLTHGQILALNGTPIQIVAAPGAGNAIMVTGMECTATFVSTAYTSTGSLSLVPSGHTSNTQATCGTGIVEAAATTHKVGGPVSNVAIYDNTALMAFMGTTNPTETGTANTVVKIRAFYRIVPVPLP